MQIFQSTITLQGTGDDPDEAWSDAVDGFMLEPGITPEDYDVIEEDLV